MNSEELYDLLLFNRITNYSTKQKLDLYERYGSASDIFLSGAQAESIYSKPFKINGKPVQREEEQEKCRRELDYYTSKDVHIIDIHSRFYPVRLKYIYDPPLVIFAQGNVELLNHQFAVGIVGARKASNHGITTAYATAWEIAKWNAMVVSGLAAGIDLYAHKGALEIEDGGGTIAVLGNGIDVVYPKDNRLMYDRIRKEGLLISEFSLGTSPFKRNFPQRNRIISGLSLAVVIVEAGKNSGALITAMYALDQGREVMAFPGKAASESYEGNNRLIKEGAHLVENALDILSVLGKEVENKSKRREVPYSPLERDILRVIGDEKVSIEDIDKVLDRPISTIASALMMLEINGVVTQHPGKLFTKV
jgi:DNA processing protein